MLYILTILLLPLTLVASGDVYPRILYPGDCPFLFRQGAYMSFRLNKTGCRIFKQSSPPIKMYSFGEDIRHGRYVLYGPLNNLTFWRQRHADNRDVKREGPVLRLTGVEMDAIGYANVYIEDYDPVTLTKLAYLHMGCAGVTGFLPFAQTPGGKVVEFDKIVQEITSGSLLAYSTYPSWCEPKPQNYTHIFIEAGPIDEYRFDSEGSLVFTYRILQNDLSLDIVAIKLTSSTDITMVRYTYSQITGKSGPLETKTCKYGDTGLFFVYKISSPQS